jgi:hypothetical protein
VFLYPKDRRHDPWRQASFRRIRRGGDLVLTCTIPRRRVKIHGFELKIQQILFLNFVQQHICGAAG